MQVGSSYYHISIQRNNLQPFFFSERGSFTETFNTVLFQVKNFTFCIEFNYTLIHRQVVSDSCNCMDCRPTRLISPSHFPRKNTGVRCHFLLQGIFPNQRLNSDLLHSGGSPALQADSLMTEPPGKLIHSLNSIYIYICQSPSPNSTDPTTVIFKNTGDV